MTPDDESGVPEALRRALIAADPRLSRFNPLPRILAYDDFDEGANGWCELVGNHDGDLDNVRFLMRDLRPPQLSTCTFFDVGTHGAMHGTYCLKVATRARPGHAASAIKRLTTARRGLVQFETYFAYKAEATVRGASASGVDENRNDSGHGNDAGPVVGRAWDGNYHPSEAQFGDFTIGTDFCEPDGHRYHVVLRYVNTNPEGRFVRRWRYKTSVQQVTRMQLAGTAGGTGDLHTLSPLDWEDVPGGAQQMCFNEVPTKVNWHYLRWLLDTRVRRSVELQVNDLTMDLRDVPVPAFDHPYEGLSNLLNFYVDVRTHVPVRNFLYLDSTLISVDW